MQNKKSLLALALMIVLAVPMVIVIGQASAQTSSTVNLPTFLYLNASPSPVGAGQTVYITLFFTKPVPRLNYTGFVYAGTQYEHLTINVIKPDGTNETLGPYTSDTTGGVPAVDFTPSVTGNYTLQAVYPGQSLGSDGRGNTYNLDPDMSPAVTIVVQQTPVAYWTPTPMPTSYWTTPIYASNYYWAQSVGGNWYGLGRPGFDNTGGYDGSGNNFQPYSTAPTTAHILWTLPTTFGGQPGGETAANEMTSFSANSPLYHIFEPIILDGVLYYSWYPAQTDYAGIQAVNLFTGQIMWTKNTTDTLVYGQIITFHTTEEFGSAALLWAYNPATSNYDILDPVTGNYMATITGIPSTIAGLFSTSTNALIDSNEPNGEGAILIYYTNTTNAIPGNPYSPAVAESLTMWNSTLCFIGAYNFMTGASGAGNNGLNAELATGNFKPSGTYHWSDGIQWSVPVPSTSLGISAETPQGILMSAGTFLISAGIFAGFSQFGGSYVTDVAFSAMNGTVLFGPTNETLQSGHNYNLVATGEGVYVRLDKDTDQAYGYSLYTGKLLWGPTQLVGNGLSHLYSGGAIAYGRCYIWDIGGYVNAIDLTTGKIDWTWTRGSAGYNTPYGVYPNWVFDTQSIADGMLFLSEGRCYDPPLFPGGEKVAINCTTGNLVWAINGAFQRDVSPIADGELLGWNGYDGQIYGFGIGPSRTTITAPNVGVTTATPIIISGTVTDISAGSKQTVVVANFPNGLPCVSDASMQSFMQAVYEQQPMPTNVTGVPVTISVTDSNHNTRVIGQTTTNVQGDYGISWTPDITGNYTVTAVFAGTQSYYGSSATTYFVAGSPAPTQAPTATPISQATTQSYIMYGVASIIIVVIVCVAVLAVLMLRKRP